MPAEVTGPAKAPRTLVSFSPSESKAIVKIGDKSHKVVYHVHDGKALIGIPGEPSVFMAEWLIGAVDLKGLPG